MELTYKYFSNSKWINGAAVYFFALILLPSICSCGKRSSDRLDMSPIFRAVHTQATKQAKDYEGKVNQFDSTKPFYIYTNYNFTGAERECLEIGMEGYKYNKNDSIFGNKIFLEKSDKYIPIDTLPRWDEIDKRLKSFEQRVKRSPWNSSLFREYENIGEFNYYLVKMLKPVYDKKKNLYIALLHITDNVFVNRGYYNTVKFRIIDNSIRIIAVEHYQISYEIHSSKK